MAPPSIVNLRVKDIHSALIDAGWEGKLLPRDELERYLARDLGLSLPNIRAHIDMGRALGLWLVVDRRPKPGALRILAPQQPEVRSGSTPVHAAG